MLSTKNVGQHTRSYNMAINFIPEKYALAHIIPVPGPIHTIPGLSEYLLQDLKIPGFTLQKKKKKISRLKMLGYDETTLRMIRFKIRSQRFKTRFQKCGMAESV